MSFEEYKEYISFNTIKKQNEKNKYFIMIYKPNENKKEKQAIIKKIKKEYFFTIDEDKKHEDDAIRMFGKFFVKENKNKCNMIYNNKKYKLKEYFDEIDNNKEINEIKIKLTRINNISNFKKMFYGCYYLSSVSESQNEDSQQCISELYDIFPDIDTHSQFYEEIEEDNNLILSNETNEISQESINLSYGCNLLSNENIPPITKVKNNKYFENTKELFDIIENISKFHSENSEKISDISDISYMFSACISLISLPDISKWNITNVKDMKYLFAGCISLKSLPDISIWNASNVIDMNSLFYGCISLISLPDISKWDISNVIEMRGLFDNLCLLTSLPDISVWNTSNVIDISFMFNRCNSLISLPDISKWNLI